MSHICPWCQTEIIWDEEIGPEEQCPHCLNELGDYRTVSLDAYADEDERDDAAAGRSGREAAGSGSKDRAAAGTSFDDTVEAYLDAQDEMLECLHCQEDMVYAGMQQVGNGQFEPFVPNGVRQPLLQAPFGLKVYVCRTCFQVSYKLAEANRKKSKGRSLS